MRSVSIVSGGLDSVTLAYMLAAEGWDQLLVSFDYGQRHVKELESAADCARSIGAEHRIVDLTSINPLIQGSALTDKSIAVPEGHYAAPTMATTVVPNRNAMMLTIACAAAIPYGASRVSIGVHAGDHWVYPDCRVAFIEAFEAMQITAMEGFIHEEFHIYAPFLHWEKSDIATAADAFQVPIANTWSCYQGGALHCGKCGTCTERIEALAVAGVTDPTVYA